MSPFLTCGEKLSNESILTRLEVFRIVLELSVNPYMRIVSVLSL